MKKIKVLFLAIVDGMKGLKMTFFSTRKDRYGYLAPTANVMSPVWGPKQNIFIYDHCGINGDTKFICQEGRFILRRNCSIGPGFTVITFNHKYSKYENRPESENWSELEPNDVIVNEHVWIGVAMK